jgi:adenylate kinase
MASLPRAAGFAGAEVGRLSKLKSDSVTSSAAPVERSFLPGPILLLGAPGVGKGTQAQLLVSQYNIPQISTGDLLRGNIASGTQLGKQAQEIMGKGLLVDDGLVNKMVLARLQNKDTCRGYILDGYPRTLEQADFLDVNLGDCAMSLNLPVVAISIVVAYDQLLKRITGRRICPTCRSIYNIYGNPPAAEGRCNLDGTHLIQRPDDTEAVFTERMATFEKQTAPVVAHYRALGRFQEVEGDQPVDVVIASIDAALHALRASSH